MTDALTTYTSPTNNTTTNSNALGVHSNSCTKRKRAIPLPWGTGVILIPDEEGSVTLSGVVFKTITLLTQHNHRDMITDRTYINYPNCQWKVKEFEKRPSLMRLYGMDFKQLVSDFYLRRVPFGKDTRYSTKAHRFTTMSMGQVYRTLGLEHFVNLNDRIQMMFYTRCWAKWMNSGGLVPLVTHEWSYEDVLIDNWTQEKFETLMELLAWDKAAQQIKHWWIKLRVKHMRGIKPKVRPTLSLINPDDIPAPKATNLEMLGDVIKKLHSGKSATTFNINAKGHTKQSASILEHQARVRAEMRTYEKEKWKAYIRDNDYVDEYKEYLRFTKNCN